MVSESPASDLKLVSGVFREGASIPSPYTCRGRNVNPPLNIHNVPAGTQSLTLIMHDPDAVKADFLHWLIWDIPPSTESIAANSVPVGAIQGNNDMGKLGYSGPCPPDGTGTHRYVFELYALDKTLDLPRQASRQDVNRAMQGHIIKEHKLIGTFAAGS